MAVVRTRTVYLICGLFFLIFARSDGGAPLFLYSQSTSQKVLTPIDTNSYTVTAPQDVYFYGQKFRTFYVSIDGSIALTPGHRHEHIGFSILNTMSQQEYNKVQSVDKPFIAPFMFSATGGGSPRIYIQQISTPSGTAAPSRVIPSSSSQTLTDFQTYIRKAVVGASTFIPTWVLVVTWENVTDTYEVDAKAPLGCSASNPCKVNTFQAAIVAGGRETFAIFNYAQMNLDPTRPFYQAGFNAGYRLGWTPVLPNNQVANLDKIQASDVVGRFYFKISNDLIRRGGCYPRGSTALKFIEASPRYGGMLGGEMIEITGPCLTPGDNIMCQFGQGSSNGSVINNMNMMKFRCPVPMLTERGRVKLTIFLNNQVVPGPKTDFTIGNSPFSLTLNNGTSGQSWYASSANLLKMTWNSVNLTRSQSNALVDVSLYGYTEDTSTGRWQKLQVLGSQIQASAGQFQFNPTTVQCGNQNCKFQTGVVEVRLQSPLQAGTHLALYSQPVPLGWYISSNMRNRYGSTWPSQRCSTWYKTDQMNMTWYNDILYCPCNLNQALVDFGRWQPDTGCNMFTGSKCTYHIGAIHCVRAVQPTKFYAGNQCCYGANRLLMYSADTYQGSTSDRSHAWGSYPYNVAGSVPGMSHWLQDVVPFYYCCLWTNYKSQSCNYYMEQRTTRDCHRYRSPRAAIVYGQSHIATFDGQYYQMQVPGDFTLLNGGNSGNRFLIQGKFGANMFKTNAGRSINGSFILTSVAVRSGLNADTVEIRLRRPQQDRSRRLLDILINKRIQYFNTTAMYWQDFQGVTVINTDTNPKNMQSNVTIILKNDIGIQVAAVNNLLQLLVMVPPTYRGSNIMGLLGNWDGVAANDQTSVAFQITEAVPKQTQSLFTFYSHVNTSTMMFTNPTGSQSTQVCGSYQECIFDYRKTGSSSMASATRKARERYLEIQAQSQAVRSCGLLDVPRSSKSSNNYTVGNTVTITGCRSGKLTGSGMTYTCQSTGGNNSQAWYPQSITAQCQVNIATANVGVIVGAVIGSLLGLLIICAIIFFVVRLLRKSNRGSPYSGRPDEKRQGVTMHEVGDDQEDGSRPEKPVPVARPGGRTEYAM